MGLVTSDKNILWIHSLHAEISTQDSSLYLCEASVTVHSAYDNDRQDCKIIHVSLDSGCFYNISNMEHYSFIFTVYFVYYNNYCGNSDFDFPKGMWWKYEIWEIKSENQRNFVLI